MNLYLEHPGSGLDVPPAEPQNAALHAIAAPKHCKPSEVQQSRVALIELIEGEIIPRLFMAHRHQERHPLAIVENSAGELGNPDFLAKLFLAGDSAYIVMRLQSLLCAGTTREQVYIDLLAPVPGTLSRLWAEGRSSFDEIARGLCCIDEVLGKLHEAEKAMPASR